MGKRQWVGLLVTAVTLSLLAVADTTHHVSASSSGGITVTPAVVQLTLEENETRASATIDVTNNYDAPITFYLAISPDLSKGATLRQDQVDQIVAVEGDKITLQPGQSKRQTLSVTDTPQLPPGSQALQLAITQLSQAGTGVGITSRALVPVTILKKTGAVKNYTVSGVTSNSGLFTVPTSATVKLTSTGNTVLIPRGTVVVTDPDGKIVAKGVLNATSLALSPRGTLALDTPLTHVATARIPGSYRTSVFYSLGGPTGAKKFTTDHWYIAWWHGAPVALLVVGLIYSRRRVYQTVRKIRPAGHRGDSP